MVRSVWRYRKYGSIRKEKPADGMGGARRFAEKVAFYRDGRSGGDSGDGIVPFVEEEYKGARGGDGRM